jgi:ribonuclease P protein component
MDVARTLPSGFRRFDALRRTRHKVRSGPLRVSWVPGGAEGGPVRVAFAIGRRVGPAVVRNRVRRRLRAAFLELRPAPGDYLMACDPATASLSFSELKALVQTALTTLSPPTPGPAA